MDQARATRVRELAETLRKMKLGGEWGWHGNTEHGSPYLSTKRHGRQFLILPGERHVHVTYTEDYDEVLSSEVSDHCVSTGCPYNELIGEGWGGEDPVEDVYLPGDEPPDGAEPKRTHTHMQTTPTFVFRTPLDDERTTMRLAHEIPVFEVCPDATGPDDPRVYRTDVVGFRSPVAEWLAEVDADFVLSLLDTIDKLSEKEATT